MKTTHKTVVVLFILAILCYSASWPGIAIGIGILGFLLEIAAWTIWVGDDAEPKD